MWASSAWRKEYTMFSALSVDSSKPSYFFTSYEYNIILMSWYNISNNDTVS